MDEQRGKWKVQEASWMTSKRLSFMRGSRVISFSELPDPSMNQEDKAVPTDRKVCTSVRLYFNSELLYCMTFEFKLWLQLLLSLIIRLKF